MTHTVNVENKLQKFWDIQYSRSQCLKLLELTGAQFDYLVKTYEVPFIKIGHGVIFTGKQLFDMKLILYLKGLKYPADVIKEILKLKSDRDEDNQIIPTEEIKEFEKYRVFCFSKAPNNYTIFVEIEKQIGEEKRFQIHRFPYQDDMYLFLNEEQLNHIGKRVIDEIEEVDTLSMKPIVRRINNELQASSEKHNILIGVS